MSYPTRPDVGGRARRSHSPAGTRTKLDLLNTVGAQVIIWHAPPNSISAHALDQLRESLPKNSVRDRWETRSIRMRRRQRRCEPSGDVIQAQALWS